MIFQWVFIRYGVDYSHEGRLCATVFSLLVLLRWRFLVLGICTGKARDSLVNCSLTSNRIAGRCDLGVGESDGCSYYQYFGVQS